jgi:small-conductance mechanosensitive channel
VQLSDLGFVVELVYHIQGNEVAAAARIQHRVTLKIVAEFEEVGLEFAFNPR